MLKPIVTAVAAIAIAGSTIVYAQQRFGGLHDGERTARVQYHRMLSVDDINTLTDARLAALKAGLQLTTDQEKNWPAFEQAVRDLAKLRMERMAARRAAEDQPPPSSPFDRMQRHADALSQFGTALKRLADAGAPLYHSLDDAQKHRFKLLAHMLRPRHFAGGFWEHHGFDRDGPAVPRDHFDDDHGGPHGMMEHRIPGHGTPEHGMMEPDREPDEL